MGLRKWGFIKRLKMVDEEIQTAIDENLDYIIALIKSKINSEESDETIKIELGEYFQKNQ